MWIFLIGGEGTEEVLTSPSPRQLFREAANYQFIPDDEIQQKPVLRKWVCKFGAHLKQLNLCQENPRNISEKDLVSCWTDMTLPNGEAFTRFK